MKIHLDDGDAHILGRSPEKSRELLEKAEKAGIDPALIRTTSDGYIVPKELGGDTAEDDGTLEVGMGVPTKGYSTAIDQSDDANKGVAHALLEDVQPVEDAGAVEGAILNQSQPTDAKTEGTAEGNGSQTVGDSAEHVTAEDYQKMEEERAEGNTPDAPNQKSEEFDPADHTVEEVKEYLEAADDDERERVLAAEAEGKGRKTLLPDEEGK